MMIVCPGAQMFICEGVRTVVTVVCWFSDVPTFYYRFF